ncbi:MAG: molybdopterin-dependent oxidoreductase [Amphiplicatus sp.]
MQRTEPTICRLCSAFCPILVSFENGRPVKVVGDPEGAYEGYTCPKGRALPELYNDPRRLLTSQKRQPDGSFAPISSDRAIEEIAERLQEMVDEHGPRSVAAYFGTGILTTFFGAAMSGYFLKALGSPMLFDASSIDKPAEKIALALHGHWHAGSQSFESSDSWIIVGANPIIAKSNGAPTHNPGMRLKQAVNRGMKLIVIDPRRTETAKRAHIHLQPRPGEDPAILAGIANIILSEALYDAEFVEENAVGLAALKAAVAPFTPDYVAHRADIPSSQLIEAARSFAKGKRGMVSCSTGPSFATHSNLSFYLGLCINTLCGRWARPGDRLACQNILLPAYSPRAEPRAPYSLFSDEVMRATGLRRSVAGMPTAALADEILYDGPERVRALISVGGNPVSAWPDQRKTEAALGRLDLLVQMDVFMSATARRADYVIAGPMALEAPYTTYLAEMVKYIGPVRGMEIPWAQYAPALLGAPEGSDVVAEHAFFFRLAKKMGLQLHWANIQSIGKHEESPTRTGAFDMNHEPSLDEMWELLTIDARIPLSEVKKYPHGKIFDLDVRVENRDPGCADKLQLGDPMMMQELAAAYAEENSSLKSAFPFQLVNRRLNHYNNSQLISLPSFYKRKPYNPLYVHPDDMRELGLVEGRTARLHSKSGSALAVVETDPTLRRGVVAMSHGFGGMGAESEADPRIAGTNVNLLISQDEADPITGLPRMSAIPVSIEGIA